MSELPSKLLWIGGSMHTLSCCDHSESQSCDVSFLCQNYTCETLLQIKHCFQFIYRDFWRSWYFLGSCTVVCVCKVTQSKKRTTLEYIHVADFIVYVKSVLPSLHAKFCAFFTTALCNFTAMKIIIITNIGYQHMYIRIGSELIEVDQPIPILQKHFAL